MSAEHPLWFYWGHRHMTFLRYMTLRSACSIHGDVRLVMRDEEISPSVPWAEDQDFRHSDRLAKDWFPAVMELPLKHVRLEEVAPAIADLRTDDVHTSDLLSWWLMSSQGGTVCDMDIVFLKALPPIVEDVEIVAHPERPGLAPYVPIAYMQGRPNAKWQETYQRAMERHNPMVYQSCGGECLRPWPEGRLSWFIVYPWFGCTFRSILNYCLHAPHWPAIPDDCIGIHWYGGGMQERNQAIQGPGDLTSGALSWAVREVLKKEVIVP